MKTIYLNLLLIMLNVISIQSQSDSTINTIVADVTCYRTYVYRIRGTDSVYKEGVFEDISGIKSLRFVRDDSLVFNTNENCSFGMRTKNIKKLSYQKNNSEGVWQGAVFGGALGVTTGLLLGWLTASLPDIPASKKEDHNHLANYLVGGIVGLTFGIAIGTLIEVSDNTKTLNLLAVPDKDKKAKLITFLRKK